MTLKQALKHLERFKLRTIYSGVCFQCGELFFAVKKIARFCSQRCISLKPGVFHDNSNGYRIRKTNGKPLFQHRLVMEEYLGRKLKKKEKVHHINHNRADNRIENLIIVSSSENIKLNTCVLNDLIKEVSVGNLRKITKKALRRIRNG